MSASVSVSAPAAAACRGLFQPPCSGVDALSLSCLPLLPLPWEVVHFLRLGGRFGYFYFFSRGERRENTVSRQFLTRNYPRPKCLLKCLQNCLSPTREGIFSSFKITPAVRVTARQLRDKNCLAAIFAPRHQGVSFGPLGLVQN